MNEQNSHPEIDIKQSLFGRLSDMYYELFELMAVIVLAILSVITVSEMSSRESFSHTISSKIASLNTELANLAVSLTSDTGLKVDDATVLKQRDATETIEIYEVLRDKVSTLISVGVSEQSGTLDELTKFYQSYSSRFSTNLNQSKSEVSPLDSFTVSTYVDFIYKLRTDHLLALSIISCSALGAMIFGLRTGTRMSVRTLTSGLATGFIVYLALKGGQHLFLVSSPDIRIPTNPYSSAFLGLLSGLFSDRAYKVLSSLVDDLANRVENTTNKS